MIGKIMKKLINAGIKFIMYCAAVMGLILLPFLEVGASVPLTIIVMVEMITVFVSAYTLVLMWESMDKEDDHEG